MSDKQPTPKPNQHPHIVDMVIEDLKERKESGIANYGTPLQPYNGRDATKDLYEELLDATQYLKQHMLELAEFNKCHIELEKASDDCINYLEIRCNLMYEALLNITKYYENGSNVTDCVSIAKNVLEKIDKMELCDICNISYRNCEC